MLFGVWLAYFLFFLACVNFLLSLHGDRPEFVAYFWVVWGGFALGGALLAWKHDHLLVRVVGLLYLTLAGYVCSRTLIEELAYMAPARFALHAVLYAGLALNLLTFLGDVLVTVARREVRRRLAGGWSLLSPKRHRASLVAEVGLVALLVLVPTSYAGFGATVTFADDPSNALKISVYHWPTGGSNYSWYVSDYSKAQADAELARYQALNTTFYFGCPRSYFTDPQRRSNLTAVVNHLAAWGIDVVPVIAPKVEVPPGSGTFKSDFSTIYNYEYDLATIDLFVEWLEEENLPNVRGFSLDVEGPIYAEERGEVVNASLWAEAVAAYQAKFDEFQARFPEKITHLIAMPGIAVDYFDGDDDLDVAQKTASVPPVWTTYGFMWYQIDDRMTGYAFYRDVNYAVGEFGLEKVVPWIGWFGDTPPDQPELLVQHPSYWENAKEQVKIAKSMGVKEVVLAPGRNVRGRDHSVALQRLDELAAIRNAGFEPFSVRITQDRRLWMDIPTWIRKFVPSYFVASEDVFKDLEMGTATRWFEWSSALVLVAATFAGILATSKRKLPA
ncbi:MAG: hypothetical protein Kow0069_25170 [Promethearchaeota archaeon]